MADEVETAVKAAWAYEELHVDALFRQWVEPVLDAGEVAAGSRVLDVACGTGVVAREAHARVGSSGEVTGLDVNDGMLAVARSIEPDVVWVHGDAAALPFAAESFDAVVSQFGLMFFGDRVGAIREMLRCAKPGSNVVVAVWDSLERTAAYAALVDLLDRRAGPAAAEALRAPFVLGDIHELRGVFELAGASAVSITTRMGTARFPSVRAMVEADLRGWLPVMGVPLDDDLVEAILHEAEDVLRSFVTDGGRMEFVAPAHMVTAQP